MALETGTYIDSLVTTNPPNTDGVSQADDHLRLIKSTVKATFPNITGAVTATHTQLNHVSGVTSAIQTQLDAKQPLDASLTAYAALTTAANKGIYYTASDTPATFDLSAYARTLLDDADAATARATLGVGTGDSPQFAAINVGNASDTTITRSAAGVLAVEGGVVPLENRNNWFLNPQSFTATGAGSSGAIALRQNSGDTAGAFIQWTNNNATVQQGTIVVDTAAVMLFSAAGGINLNGRLLIDTSGNVLNMSSGGLGYGTGSGGTVTQLTNKSTGVTLNKTNGQIVTSSAALGAASEIAFTVTNSTVAATDTVIVSKVSGGVSTKYIVYVGAVAAGSFDIAIRNVSGTSGSDAITLNFAVIKAVTS